MSGHGFHVHGPHDHELEHAQQGGHGGHGDHGSGGMINQIAMFTAIIATVGAVFGYMGGATQANAGLYKNNAGTISSPKAPNNHWPSWPATSHLTTRRQLTNPRWIVTRRRKAKSRLLPTSSKPTPPSGTSKATSKCTSTTAGPSPLRCCRFPSHWRRLPC